MSGTQTSTFSDPNILYKSLSGLGTAEVQEKQNQLLQQQQDIGGHEMEMASRLAGTLLSQYTTPEARAAAYPTLLANARAAAPGYFKNAPSSYPGDDATHALFQLGTSSADLYKLQLGLQGGQETLRALGIGTGATAPAAGGGGTNAPPGTSTPAAPLSLADIHPDLTQFRLPSGAGATVAKSAAPQFQGLLTDLEAAGYKLDPDTTGGYNPRNIAGTNTPSQHSYGLAMDVNWQRNPRGANTQADIPPDLARSLAAKWGLTWGGDWQGADRDPMHFEVARGSGPGTDHPKGVATGWNANNPLNLTTDSGGVVTPGGARLANFGSMADGVAATAAKLQSYQTDRGLNTVRQMYTEWHKGSAVNDADMQRIAGAMGVGVDQPFQLDPTKTAAWITAAQPGETGTAGKRLSQADIAAGVRQASAGPVAPAGGVAARTGGTNTAGPGAGSGTAAAAPGQAPAAQPTVPGLPPPPQTNPATGFTPTDEAVLTSMARGGYTREQILAEADKRRTANTTAQRQYTLDVQAQQEKAKADAIAAANLQATQESGQRDTERLKLAQAEAAVKAKQAAQPYQGTDIGAQDTNVLMTADPKSKEYAIAYERMATPHYNQDGSVVYPNLSAFEKPGYAPPGGGQAPDYGATRVTPPTILTQDQARAATYADRMTRSDAIMSQLDNAALDYVQKGLSRVGGVVGFGLNSADYQRVEQAQKDFVNAALRLESGAVINPDEFKKAAEQYFPQPGDSAAVIAQKKANRAVETAGFSREAGPGYRPPASTTPASRVIRYDHAGNRVVE